MKVISHSKALRLMEHRKATEAWLDQPVSPEFQAWLDEQAIKYPHGCMFPPASESE